MSNLTHPVGKNRLCMLTGSDLMLVCHGEQRVWSLGEAARARMSRCGTGASDPVSSASGHYLTMRALRIDRWDQAADVESGGHVDEDP